MDGSVAEQRNKSLTTRSIGQQQYKRGLEQQQKTVVIILFRIRRVFSKMDVCFRGRTFHSRPAQSVALSVPFCYLAVLNESNQRPYLHVAIELTKCQWEFVTFGGSSLSEEINDYIIT